MTRKIPEAICTDTILTQQLLLQFASILTVILRHWNSLEVPILCFEPFWNVEQTTPTVPVHLPNVPAHQECRDQPEDIITFATIDTVQLQDSP